MAETMRNLIGVSLLVFGSSIVLAQNDSPKFKVNYG
jgi:hypothetical protein